MTPGLERESELALGFISTSSEKMKSYLKRFHSIFSIPSLSGAVLACYPSSSAACHRPLLVLARCPSSPAACHHPLPALARRPSLPAARPCPLPPSSISLEVFVAQHGQSINIHNRMYRNGAALSHSKKVTIAFEYLEMKAGNDDDDKEPNIAALSGKCKISRGTILKARDELRDYGRVLSPEEIRSRVNSNAPSGPGSCAMTPVDEAGLYALYLLEPSRSLKSYKILLYNIRGIIVGKSTIGK